MQSESSVAQRVQKLRGLDPQGSKPIEMTGLLGTSFNQNTWPKTN